MRRLVSLTCWTKVVSEPSLLIVNQPESFSWRPPISRTRRPLRKTQTSSSPENSNFSVPSAETLIGILRCEVK